MSGVQEIEIENCDGSDDVNHNGDQANTTAGEFGESGYGARLDYSKSEYKDLWAMILFCAHVVAIFVLAIVFWSDVESTDSGSDTDTDADTDTDTRLSSEDTKIEGIIIALFASLAMGGVFGLLWLQCIRMIPEMIIKVMLGLQIVAWLVVAVIGFMIDDGIALTVIGVIVAAICALYTWCVWSRIPFAGVCLSIAASITQKYSGIVWLSFAAVFMAFIWYILWGMTVFGYVGYTDGKVQGIVVFLLLVSLYWGAQVCQNVSHTTTCGVAATWYFNSGELDSPSKKAFKRTMTTSFGSICFGSLIVAILQAIRAMVKSQRRSPAACIAMCILACIERMIRYFNKYAFAQVAIYGANFVDSGKRTWDLFMNRGISALVNDDLSGLALICGAFFGFLVCAGTSVGVSVAFYDDIELHILLGLVGGFLGYCVVVIILMVVASGVIALFVCFAEDPAACKENRPDEYERLVGTNDKMMAVSRTANSEK